MSAELSTLERNCCVCGYHIYHSIWDLTVGEELLCKCELTNLHDRYVCHCSHQGQECDQPFTSKDFTCLFLRRGGNRICKKEALPWAKNISISTMNFFHQHLLLYQKYFVVQIRKYLELWQLEIVFHSYSSGTQ